MNRPLIIAAVAVFFSSACTGEQEPVKGPPAAELPDLTATKVLPGAPYFTDMAAASGVRFEHFAGTTGEFYFPEILGPGVGLFDYDSDGDLDIYAVQGAAFEPSTAPTPRPTNRLYQNQLIPSGELTFIDVTERAGLGDAGYGMGVATGDVDNDGDVDLVVTNFGQDHLYQNLGDGRFERVAGALAVDQDDVWTTSSSFADVDGDGDLDWFASHYVGFGLRNIIRCTSTTGELEFCGPNTYPPTVDRLWRNEGGLTFQDISAESGVAQATGNGLGTSAADFDGDGDVDIYVANDQMENRLWTQRDDGRFSDTALMAGSAYNGSGAAEASMGVTAGDFDGDGDEDLFMTHLAAETNTLYQNDGSGNFFDITDAANLSAVSLRLTGFGTGWIDFDNDGWLDLFIANGAVTVVNDERADPAFRYGQPNQLLRNIGGRFVEVSASAGESFALRETSRGAAFGDIDNDGDVDVVVGNANGLLRLLRNNANNDNGWLRVRLIGTTSNRDGAGARVSVSLADGRVLWRRAHTDGSFLSASDIRVHIGLGQSEIKDLRVHWPSGAVEHFATPVRDVQVTLTEGEGERIAP